MASTLALRNSSEAVSLLAVGRPLHSLPSCPRAPVQAAFTGRATLLRSRRSGTGLSGLAASAARGGIEYPRTSLPPPTTSGPKLGECRARSIKSDFISPLELPAGSSLTPMKIKSRKSSPKTTAILELITVLAVAGAVALPILLAATAVAGTVMAITGVMFSFIVPLALLAFAASGILGVALPLVWSVLDKLLFLAVALNFVIGVIGLQAAKNSPHMLDVPNDYRKTVPKNVRKWLSEEGIALDKLEGKSSRKRKGRSASRATEGTAGEVNDPRKGFWVLPSLLSAIPGVHGAAWLAAFSDWPAFAVSRWDVRAGLLRNALIYGGTGLLGALLGNPFGAPATTVTMKLSCLGPFFCSTVPATVATTSYANSGSFWLSLVLGAAHLQLDRAWLKQIRQAQVGEGGSQSGGLPTVIEMDAQVDELRSERDLSKKDLEEFDARLRYRTTGGALGVKVSEWTTTEVALWLEDNGLGSHVDSFKVHDITGAVLLNLSDSELRAELGMDRLGQRKRLLLLVDELKKTHHI